MPRLSVADFHAHIIPHADHGSSSSDESMDQLDIAASFGVDRIVATPHFYPERHSAKEFLERRNAGYERLMSRCGDDVPDIRLGAEVLICNGIEHLPDIEKLCINGTSAILLELPFADFQHEYCDSVYSMVRDGFEVIMAHADRYDPDNIERMLDSGAKLQLNADSLCRLFKPKRLYDWIDRGVVVALGSDIHERDKTAYKHFSTAIGKLGERIVHIREESDRIWSGAVKLPL